jgi:protein-disulfide isomerase
MQRRRFCFTLILTSFLLTRISSAEDATPPAASEIKLELFSDFQCPFCGAFYKPIRELQTKGVDGAKVTVEFKNFPLSFHPDAQLAAQAGVAAREQGTFWEMHDLMFSNQSAIKRDDLLKDAEKLGLDMERFRKDLDSDRIKSLIQADIAEGSKRGVQGTPTFFVNGKEHSGTMSFEELSKLVQNEHRRDWVMTEITDNLMSKGPAGAPVTIEFFADLQSPVTIPAAALLDELLARYPSNVRVQFRNFPLAFHPQAVMTHSAAMAAARQGHFWEFATYILDHQDSVREQDLIAYAGKLGMDEAEFAGMVQDRRYGPRVDADVADGFRRGIRGSPVILVNDKRIDGVPSLQKLTEYVEAELAGKK